MKLRSGWPKKKVPSPANESAQTEADDARLFRESIGDVRPIVARAIPATQRKRPVPDAAQARRDEAAVLDELLNNEFDPGDIEIGDELLYLKPGQSPQLLKRLRRGHYSIRAEVDLHQMTIPVAREAIRGFLAECQREGEHCVRIIHGKGLRSKAAGPVIKKLTDSILRKRGDVLAYASARPAQGGTGAVIVLLAR
ncbi:MAG: Smr/MutS family protein [Dokdonella sp.]